jgi:Ca-activated chloride channel homolog
LRAGAVLAASCLAARSLSAQPVPTFTASVEAVYVDVFVTRDGRPVEGLTAADFEVRDNGVKQDVTLVSLDEVPIVAMMVFDASASLAGARLEDLRSAGRALLAGLRAQDEAMLVTFSHELRIAVPLGSDRSAVQRALEGLVPGGHTALWDALYAGLKLPVAQGRPLVVLFTDGRDDLSWLSPEQVVDVARESNALVHVVAIVPPDENVIAAGPGGTLRTERRTVEPRRLRALRQVAEVTGGRLWPASASAQLGPTFLGVLAEMQSRYLLSYTPSGVPREGWHRLAVKVKGRKGIVRSRSAYFVPGRPR